MDTGARPPQKRSGILLLVYLPTPLKCILPCDPDVGPASAETEEALMACATIMVKCTVDIPEKMVPKAKSKEICVIQTSPN